MNAPESKRKRGGVSRSIDYLISSLIDPDPADEAAKPGAMVEMRNLMNLMINQANNGDADCGYFLAELLAYLWKHRDRLSNKNELFRTTYARWESSRLATKKASALRALIGGILADAIREKNLQELCVLIPHSSLVIKRNKTLLALPEFQNSSDVVSAWTDAVVYPSLRAKESELEKDPVIGNLKKAKDPNGKFRISRLKPLIRQTVARIAAVPRSYYFSLS